MAHINSYDIGDKVRLKATFKVSGVVTDPTAIILRVKDPSGNKDVYTYALGQITKDSTGVYHKDISVDEYEDWFYRYEGTGAVEAAEETKFRVEVSEF